MIRAEQHTPNCCYCEKPVDDRPMSLIGGQPIHEDCREELHLAMDPHREEPTPEEIEEANMNLDLDYAFQLYPQGGC